jgi:hypothetical protein
MKYVVVVKDPSQGGYIAALTLGEKFLEGWGATAEDAVEDLEATANHAGLVNWLYCDEDLEPDWELR